MPLLTPHVPGGLIDLMKNLAKEVLRDKPENIYEFAAVHFEKLIQQRDGSLDKDYEQFAAFQMHFDGQQRFAVPANSGYTCQRPVKIQPILHTKKSKSDMLASFKAMESINEEDVLTETPYSNEKYQKAIYVIQRYYRRYMAQKKNQSSPTLTATTAAIIIQRTMRRLFANKIKLKTNDEDTAKHDGVVQDDDDVDNVSEAASYTSSSTIQMLADSQEGRENRLPGREVALSDVSGTADDGGSAGFKEQTTVAQDAAPIVPPPSTTESSEANGKSIADENGNLGSIHQEETTPNHHTPAHDDDTSTAHIGKFSTIIGSNDQQNSLHTYTVEIDSNSSDPTHIITPVVAVGKTPPSLGASPNTLPSTSPRLHREEHFAVHLHGSAYAENSAANPYQSVAHIRKFDPNTGESLKTYDVFSQDRDDPDLSDSLNESTMERDSLENEDLDVDSLESNESVTHVSGGIAKREVAQDYGELYGNTNEVPGQGTQDVHQSVQLERAPTYLYGIHPSRTPIAERKNKRSRNPSAESTKVSDTKDLARATSLGIGDKTPEERSEEESSESKGSTSEESSVTEIENVSDVAHKTDRKAAGGDDLKNYEGASIKIDAVDGVPSGSLQRETTSAGNELAINSGEEAMAQTDDALKHERDFSMENSLDDTKTPVEVAKRDGASASVSEEVTRTHSVRLSQKTGSGKPEIHKADNVVLQLAVDKGLSKENALENEDALSSKKPLSGLVEITNKLAHGLAKSESLVAEVEDQKARVSPVPKDSSKPPAAIEDASQIDSEPSRDRSDGRLIEVAVSGISDRASDKVSNTNTENLPEEEGLAKGSFETKEMLVSDGGSIENGTKDGSKVHQTTILEKTETADDQAKTTARHKRSLHDADLVHADRSDQEPSLAVQSATKSHDNLTGNMEANSKSVGSATYDHPTNKHYLKVEKQVEASSLNSQLGYFANLYSDQSSGGTTSSILDNHDQQVESQLRELQSLTNLYPGLEIKDVISEFHTRDIQPDDRGIDEDIAHDDSKAYKLGKTEESPKDQKREPSIEDSRSSVGEKTEGKDQDGHMGQPKGLQESSIEIEEIPMNNPKIGATMEESKMEKDEVSNRDDEGGISRAIKTESVSGLNKAFIEDSLERHHKSQKTTKGVLQLGGDRIGEDSKSDIDATVYDNVKGSISPTVRKDDKIEIKSEISKQTKDENLNTLTPVTSSSKLADKSHEKPAKSDEVKPPLTARAEPKPQVEDYFGNTIDRDILANDNPVIEILKADGVTLKAAGSKLPKVKEEPHDYVRDSVQIIDSVSEKPTDHFLRQDKLNFTDAQTDANLEVSLVPESWLEREKEILPAQISSLTPNEGIRLSNDSNEQRDTVEEHKSNESHYSGPKIRGENASDSIAGRGDSLATKEKNCVDNELTSSKVPNEDDSPALINSQKHPSTGMQPLADLEMSKLSKSDVEYLKNITRLPDGLQNDVDNIKEGKTANYTEGEVSMAVKSDSFDVEDKYRIQSKLTSDKIFEPNDILASNKSEKHPSKDIELCADSEMFDLPESSVEHPENKTELSNVFKSSKDNIQEGKSENDTEVKNKMAHRTDSLNTEDKYRDENESTSGKIPKRAESLATTKAENHASTDIEPAPGLEMSKLSESGIELEEHKTGLPDIHKNHKDNVKDEKDENNTESKNKMADRTDSLNTEEKSRDENESTSGKIPKRAESLALTKAENHASTDIEPAPGLEMSKLLESGIELEGRKTGLPVVLKNYKDNFKEGKDENNTESKMAVKSDSFNTEEKYRDVNESTAGKIPKRAESLATTKAENHASTDIEPAPGLEMSKLSESGIELEEHKTGLPDVHKNYKDNVKDEKDENNTESKNKMADRADSLNTEEKSRDENEFTSGKIPKRAESLALTKAENHASTDIEPAPGLEMSKLSESGIELKKHKTELPDVLKNYKDSVKEGKDENNTESKSKMAVKSDSFNTEEKYRDVNESTSGKIPKRAESLAITKAENHVSTDIEPAPGLEMSKLLESGIELEGRKTRLPVVLKNYKDNVKEEKDKNNIGSKNKMAVKSDSFNTEEKYLGENESTSGKIPKRAESLATTKAENHASTDIEPAPGLEMSKLLESGEENVKSHKSNENEGPISKGNEGENREKSADNNDKAIVTNYTLQKSKAVSIAEADKKHIVDNELTSTTVKNDNHSARRKAEQLSMTDSQTAAISGMSEPAKIDIEPSQDVSSTKVRNLSAAKDPGLTDDLQRKNKGSKSERGQNENKENDDGTEKTSNKNENPDQMKGSSVLTIGNDRLVENLPTSGKFVKADSSDVKQTSQDLEVIEKPFSIQRTVTDDDSSESVNVEIISTEYESVLPPHRDDSAEIKSISESSKELKPIDLESENKTPIPINTSVEENFRAPMESSKNAIPSLQNLSLESKSEVLERISKSASLEDKTRLGKKNDSGILDSEINLQVDNNIKAEQSEETLVGTVSKDHLIKDKPGLEFQEENVYPDKTDEELNGERSVLALNISESSAGRLGSTVSGTNEKPHQANTEQLQDSSEVAEDVLMKDKLGLEHVCSDVDASRNRRARSENSFEVKTPDPSITNIKPSLGMTLDGSSGKNKTALGVSMGEVSIVPPHSEGEKSDIAETVLKTNSEEEITVTNLPKLDVEPQITEDQIEAVNKAIGKPEPVKSIERSEPSPVGTRINKQIEDVKESKDKRLETAPNDYIESKQAEGSSIEPLNSVPSSVSLPTEVTSCDDSNAETSADFSSIGKDLDFFEDTINYLKSATAQLTTMDDIFTEDGEKFQSEEGLVDHVADADSEITPKPGDALYQAKEDAFNQTENRSPVVEGQETAKADVSDQAATTVQSAVRGYRVIGDQQPTGNINKPTKDSSEFAKNVIRNHSPTRVAHPIFAIHPAEDVPTKKPASKESKSDIRNNETEIKALAQGPEQINSKTKNPAKPDYIASHPAPPRIAREKPIQILEKSVKTDASISLQHIENPIENKSLNETQKIRSSITREKPIKRSSKPIKSDSLDETKTSVKSNSFDKGQLESPPVKTKIPIPEKQKTAAKPLKAESGKPKSKILRSKVPSTSNLLERDRSAKGKGTQLGRNVRSVSVKDQNQKVNVFDLEAIKNDLLSTKKVRSSKNSSGRTKMSQQKSNKLSKVSDSAEKSTNSIVKSKVAQGSAESKEQQISRRECSDKIVASDPEIAAVKSDPKMLSDELQSVTKTAPTAESLKENIDSSQQISATTIQKTFRGYRTRKHLKLVRDTEQSKNPEVTAVTEDKLNTVNARNGSDHVQKQSDEEIIKNSKGSDTSGIFDTLKRDVEDFKNTALDKSATKIQKTFRGFRTRKSLKGDVESPQRTTKKFERMLTPEEIEVSNKAVKNRSSLVKTHLSKEKLDQKEKGQDNFAKLNDSFEDANNEALNKAATTIQRNFRGYKTRKNIKKAKSFESISDQTFTIKSKSKEVVDTLYDDVTTCITMTEENLSNVQRVSPKIDETPNKENESGSSGIFENLKRDMDSFKNAALDKSAIKIQKTFRGYKTRKGLKNDFTEIEKSPHTTNQTSDQAASVEPKVLKTENKDHKDSRKTDTQMSGKIKSDVEEKSLAESAITIQKTLRGYKTRKVLKDDLRKINNEHGAEEISDGSVNKESSNILYDDGKTLNKGSDSKRKAKDDSFQARIFDNSQSDAKESPALDEFATTIQKTRKEMMAKDVSLKERNSGAVQLSNSGTKSDEMLTSSHPQSGDACKSESERVGQLQKLSKNASHGMKKSKSAAEIAFTDVSEKAAITIQKTYKGFKARKELKPGGKFNKDIKAKQPVSRNDVNSHITSNSEDAKSLSENATTTTKVDTESSTNSESEYLHLMHGDEIALDDPAKSFSLIKQTTRAASAGALLGAAASTIQKAFRDYHSRKESTLHKTKSYSHGVQRDNAPKETIDTSDESSTFIGPDTSFDLSDIDSVGTKSTPTLELEISNPPSFALSTHSEAHDIENDCANAAPVSENSLSVSPQRILRKRSIMDATAPLLADILRAGKSNDCNEKPQWYVGEDLIVPSTDMGPSTFQNPLASSSSFDKSSSIDSRIDSFISNLQPTPSINSAVVSTSSLLFDTKDTEMHDTIRNTPKHLNKHSRAVSAEEKRTEKETEVKNEENNCQEVHKADEKTEKQSVDKGDVFEEYGTSSHGLTDLAEGLMLTSTDPFSPRNAIEDVKDAPQATVTDLCKNCADGVHEVHEEDITMTSSGGKLPEAELSDKTENRAVNPDDTKDITHSTNEHFDEIKQFVLMEEEQKTIERSSENNESEKVNETNGKDTETSAVENVREQGEDQMSNATSVEGDDTNVGPSIALIPPSSEEETSDRESEFEKISQSDINAKREENNVTAAEKEKSPSEGADSNESEKRYGEQQQSVDICQGIVPAASDEVKEIDIVGECEKVAVDSTDSPSKTKPSGSEGVLKDSIKEKEDSTESEKIKNGLTDKVDEDPPSSSNSQNLINLEQNSEDILQDSTTVKSHEAKLDGALNLTDIETDKNPTTKPTKGSQDGSEERNQNVAIAADETKTSLENGIVVKAKTVGETKGENTTELNYTRDVENGKNTQQSRTEDSEDSGEYVSIDKLNEDSPELSSNIAHPLDIAEKSKDTLKNKTTDDQKFEDNFNESFIDKIALEDPIKVIQEIYFSSVVSEDKTAESTSHESLKIDEENASNSENGDSKVVKSNSSSDSTKEENEIPADVGLLEESELKRVESSQDGSSHKNVDEGDISKSNSNTDDVNKGANDLEPKALSEEGEVQNKSHYRMPSEEKTVNDSGNSNLVSTLDEQKQPSKELESLLTDGIHKQNSKAADLQAVERKDPEAKCEDERVDLEKSIDHSEDPSKVDINPKSDADLKAVEKKDPEAKSEDQCVDLEKSIDHREDPGKADINPKSSNELPAPITELKVTDSKDVMAINDKLKDPLPPIDSAEDSEIASKLLEGCLRKTDLSHSLGSDKQPSVNGESANITKDVESSPENAESKQNSPDQLSLSEVSLTIQANLEKLIDESVRQVENDVNPINPQDLPVENSLNEVVEKPCVKKVLPPTPLSATSDQDESELESTTTKAESSTTSPGYDGASDNDAVEIPPSLPDSLEAMTEKLRETEEMVARMHQRRASEHKISIDIADQPPTFEDCISEPIRPMRELQKSSSTEVEDDIILQKLQRGNTSRESSAQSESVVFGDSTSQLTESEDTFTEGLDVKALHRMNTIAADRHSYKPSNLLQKSVTIDDTVKYIDPEKSTEESGGSFCLDDAISADVRKKMMAYSISEADSDYYDAGERTARLHDDFNISTALDTFPSSDTDTTIVSAATKIQAGARGFLTRRRLRCASVGTKSSLNEETKTSFGNDAIGESLDRLVEEENGKRKPKEQYHRQVGVNSLPSALGNSTETETPSREHIHAGDDSDDLNLAAKLTSVAEEIIALPHGEGSSIDGQRGSRNLFTASENDVNGGQETEHESAQVPPNLEATLAARRLTLQRGDAMRNDSTPDDDNGDAKQVDPAKSIPAATSMFIHQITMVDSTTMATTPAETTTTTTITTTTERRNYSDAAMTIKMDKVKWFAMRQNSMPVQIDSEVFRVLPKHMRKRIKSAEGEQRKRIRLPRD